MNKILLTLSTLVISGNIMNILFSSTASAAPKQVKCPVIVDRYTGKYSSAKFKYRCYSEKSGAVQSGYSKHHSSDDDYSCDPKPSPTPNPDGDLSLSGPGERESVVFSLVNGGTLSYFFAGGGEFEIKVMNANTDKKITQILETHQASSGTLDLSSQTVPVFIKVEGPGAWTVSVDIN